MRRFKVLLLLVCSSVSAFSVQASANSIELLGAGLDLMPTLSNLTSPTTTSKFGFGGGLRLGFHLGGKVNFELAGFYLQEKYGYNQTVPSVTSQIVSRNVIEPQVGLALMVSRGFFLRAGGYGNITTSVSSDTFTNVVSNADLGLTPADYGAYAGLQFGLPLSPMTEFVVGGQYHLGLSNRLTDASVAQAAGSTWKDNGILITAGLRFGGMGMR